MLLYGHLDKQPEMVGWSEGLGPWTPVRRGDRLYGRGAADDGYAAFAALTAVEALQAQGVPHARCVILVETCEESGSADLPAYMDSLKTSHRDPEPRGVPRRVLRQLRPALDRDVAPRTGRRGAVGGGPRRGHPLGRERDRPVELPDRAPAPVAPRGRADGGDPAARPPRRDPARAGPAGEGGGRDARRPRLPHALRPRHAGRPLPIRPSWSSLTPGGRRSRSRAPTESRPSPTAGTSCGRGPPSRSRSACRRPSTHRPPRAG